MVTNWKDLVDEYPEEYELVEVELSSGKKCMCWWSGQIWDGYRDFESDDIKRWRKRHYETITSG